MPNLNIRRTVLHRYGFMLTFDVLGWCGSMIITRSSSLILPDDEVVPH